MTLTKYERETIINFNQADEYASVYTHNRVLQSKLAEFARKSNDCRLIKSNDNYVEYILPKKWIRINPPRQYSDEQRKKMAMRASTNFAIHMDGASHDDRSTGGQND